MSRNYRWGTLSVVVVFLLTTVCLGCKGPQVKDDQLIETSMLDEQPQEQVTATVVEEATPTPEPTPEPVMERTYKVARNDNLWDISGKGEIFADPWLWPLIFKANHSEIDDPDLIYVDQEFVIPKGATADEVTAATEDAKSTPRYRWHKAPRERLPLDYLD